MSPLDPNPEIMAEDQVMSEVHWGCSPHDSKCLSTFTVRTSQIVGAFHSQKIDDQRSLSEQLRSSRDDDFCLDEHGDLVLPRRKKERLHDGSTSSISKDIISIHHDLKTSIPQVGLQIWKGALLLSDFLLHKMHTTNELDNVRVLELGSGTGLVGVVMARKAKLVFLTDYSRDVLDNCYRNVWLNLHNRNESSERVRVRQLDWNSSWPPDASTEEGCPSCHLQFVPHFFLFLQSPCTVKLRKFNECLRPYSWSSSDIEDALGSSIFLAADVVYNDSLTDAFFRILEKMMPSKFKQVLWLALEKRYNFSIEELNVVAHGYDHFLTFLIDETKGHFKQEAGEDRRKFIGKQIDLDLVPQYIYDYERTTDLELWEIHRR